MLCSYYQLHPGVNLLSTLDIVGHFMSIGYSRFGIYNMLTLPEEAEGVERKPSSGSQTMLHDRDVEEEDRVQGGPIVPGLGP